MFNLFLLFALAVPILGDNYQINDKTNVDFLLTYSRNKMFSTGKDDAYLIKSRNDLEKCRKECSFNDKCLGIHEENGKCRELSNLGEPIESEIESYSYTKISYHNLKTTEHSLTGEVWDTNDYGEDMNTTIYLDINHNGVLDEGEQYIDTTTNNEFTFNNLSDQEAGDLALKVHYIAQRLIKLLNTKYYNLGLNNGSNAGQIVNHVHWHIIPRYKDDGLKHWVANKEEINLLEETFNKLKDNI